MQDTKIAQFKPYNQPKNIFHSFTKKYNLSKTLRFELKPHPETKKFLSTFIESDRQRDKDYQELKKIIDEYHKEYIEKSLSKNDILSPDDLKNLAKYIKAASAPKLDVSGERKAASAPKLDVSGERKAASAPKSAASAEGKKEKQKNEKSIKNLQKELRKQIVQAFQLKDRLFGKELIDTLLKWLDNSSLEDIEHKKEIVEKFRKWTTYLTGFHENRKNMYSDKEQATAISHRIINENLPKFLSNLHAYEKIEKDFPDLKTQLESLKEGLKAEFEYFKIQNIKDLFKIDLFNKCLTQTGIDNYNVIVGGKVLENNQKIQGINEKINLFRQAQPNKGETIRKISNKNLPIMQTLYKQILSDRESHSFYFEEFESRNEVLESINRYWESLFIPIGFENSGSYRSETPKKLKQEQHKKRDNQSVLQKTEAYNEERDNQSVLQKTKASNEERDNQSVLQETENLFTNLKKYELKKIYFKSSNLSHVSNKLFEDYNVIESSLNFYADNNFSTKKEKEQYLKKDFFSFDEVQKALSGYLKENEGVQVSKQFSGFEEIKKALSADLQTGQNNILAAYFNSEFSEKKYKNKNLLHFMEELASRFKKIPLSQNEFNEKEIQTIQNFLKPFIPRFKNSGSYREKNETLKPDQYNTELGSVGLVDILHLIKPVYLEKDGKIMDLEKDAGFYNEFEKLYNKLSQVFPLYNKVRNYITTNKLRTEKIKINFEDSTLLDGWDVNKESDNLAVILRKKDKVLGWKYYLGVMNKHQLKEADKMFDYHIKSDESDKNQKEKNRLKQTILHKENNENFYEKMNYKFLPDPSKMLPKVFFSKKNISFFSPSQEILEIRDKKTYAKGDGDDFALKDCHKLIDFYKTSIQKHKEWGRIFNFQFSHTSKYEDISDFFAEVANQGYRLSFDKIKSSYIEDKVQTGEFLLFQIYSKDFSTDKSWMRKDIQPESQKSEGFSSKGRPNLHTSYFKLLFEEKNLKDIVYKLNGQAEIFYRKASKQKKISHKANVPIQNKNPDNPKKTSQFKYDLIKDKRFTEDKYFFHVPIDLNFKATGTTSFKFNQDVLEFLKDDKNINIIGMDRGERHLAYWTLINQKGAILEQGSFNKITTNYKDQNENNRKMKTDYHALLERREKERDESRKAWTKIENIKELKAGYLSHLVHQISHLMIKHNAIVIFEDLNSGFKRGRIKFEKQVYQKLEKALIDKLNYLVFKEKNHEEPGGLLNAYQLTAPFESFKKLRKQTGFIFYTPAYYTSKVCPLTGFVNLIYPKYENMKKTKNYFKNFKKIYFDSPEKYFVFEYQDGKVNPSKKSESNTLWRVCSHGPKYGPERYKYNRKDRKHEKYNVTQELKNLFEGYNIDYKTGKDLRQSIEEQDQKDFFIRLTEALYLTLQLRHINTEEEASDKKDFILSPVADSEGRFFDSRTAKGNEPKNADANGAYHIALKGLKMFEDIKTNKNKKLDISPLKNKDWFEFVRKKPFLFNSKKAS